MSKLFRNKSFKAGFIVGISTIVLLKIYTIFGLNHPPCHHCVDWFAFPLPFYLRYLKDCGFESISIGCYVGEFSWLGTILNSLIAIAFSFVVGMIFKFVRDKIQTGKLKY